MTWTIEALHDLTPQQKAVLGAVEEDAALCETFFFTGGTLLKAVGIVPRESNDLDFFSFHTVDGQGFTRGLQGMRVLLERIFGSKHVQATERGFLHTESGMLIDVVMDSSPPVDSFLTIGSLRAASLSDIAAHKASALCSRDEVKDYIDVAFLTKRQNWILKNLAELAERKFGLRTVTEEKLLTELLGKRGMFSVAPGMFLRDGAANVAVVERQIDHLIQATTL